MANNNNTTNKYGDNKAVNFYVFNYENFDIKKPNIITNAKNSLVTLYRGEEFDVKVYVMNSWIRDLTPNKDPIEKIYSVGITPNWNYSTTERLDDDTYAQISGVFLVKLFNDKIKKEQEERFSGLIFQRDKNVLGNLMKLLNITDEELLVVDKKPEVTKLIIKQEEPLEQFDDFQNEDEKNAEKELAEMELNF